MYKKILSLYLLSNIFLAPLSAAAEVYKGEISVSHKLEAKHANWQTEIKDELAEDLRAKKYSKNIFKEQIIEDEAVKSIKTQKLPKVNYKKEFLKDTPILLTEENKKFKKPCSAKKPIVEKGEIVVLKPVKKISTRTLRVKFKHKQKYENYRIALPEVNEKVAFKVVKDVYKNGKVIIPKGTPVYAKIGEVSPRAMGGAPAELTLEGFELQNKDGKTIPLNGKISSNGYSLSVWIGLAELATTPFLIGLAVPVLRVLPGGQAIISPKKEYIVYY